MSIEAVLVALGTAAVRGAVKLWLKDKAIAADVGASAVDLLASRLQSNLDRRKLRRITEHFCDDIVERLTPLLANEFKRLADNEKSAAVLAVQETFDRVALTTDDLFATDLDARHLDRYLRKHGPNVTEDLSADGVALYDLLLRECCGYVIEIASGLPAFSPEALTEILRRETEILVTIKDLLGRMPQRRDVSDFGYDYRQLIARKLDTVEMFGAGVSDASGRYPLSVAYITLTAVSQGISTPGAGLRVDSLLSRGRRIFIRGEAGLGKTTLLQWLAVRSARKDFSGDLQRWNDTVPFMIPLRRYNDRDLPGPEQFLDEVGRHIADDMPKGWVQEQLRSGRGIVMIDGVDEMAPDRRGDARAWLRDLVSTFPNPRYVVTSRPGGAPADWLRGEEFFVADLQPMTAPDVKRFVHRWHEAIRAQCVDDAARAQVDIYEDGLLEQLAARHHLRKLSGYPLLCALLCALHRDRRAALPANRMDLYDVALQMLLERRDAERKLPSLKGFDRTEKSILLGELAYWFLRNNLTGGARDRVVDQIANKLPAMPQVRAGAAEVYRHLLERTGLLREPIEGRVDFVHRTFQEYLAARAAIRDMDDTGVLLANAHHDQWHEVIVMAAGHASLHRCEELMNGLLARGDADKVHRDALHLLAVACLETTPRLDPAIRAEVEQRAARLLPPKSVAAAKAFASAGEFVLDLLAATSPGNVREVAGTVRAAAEIGTDDAIPIIARFSRDKRESVVRELVAAWPKFDADAYAREVLAECPMASIEVQDRSLVQAVQHLRVVRGLRCVVPPAYDLHLIPRQIETLRLHTEGSLDLSRLDTPLLASLEISIATHGLPAINVSSLRRFDRLASLSISDLQIDGMAHLASLALKSLRLVRIPNVAAIAATSGVWQLDELTMIDTTELTDFAAVGGFRGIASLTVSGATRLRTLAGIEKLAESLVRLELTNSASTTLTPVVKLTRLTEINLHGTSVSDITPVAQLPQLRSLKVSSVRTAQALEPLRACPSLRELEIGKGGPVNLAALAGVRNLTVTVRGITTVLGEDKLGPGSRVVHKLED